MLINVIAIVNSFKIEKDVNSIEETSYARYGFFVTYYLVM